MKFKESKNLQIAIETVVRCGGNCSGCALSSSERMSKSSLDISLLNEKVKIARNFIDKNIVEGNIESISIFLGQGDHFLLDDIDIQKFVDSVSEIVPNDVLHKTVFFISASAIGKHSNIVRKMDLFYEYFLEKKIPFFVQVVFDPKKIELTDTFRDTYIKNISYFKSKCGMTELTVNLGSDLYETMNPEIFSNFVKSMGITHVEFNWVLNNNTYKMWSISHNEMFEWLKKLLDINARNHCFEINFIPYFNRAFNFAESTKDLLLDKMISEISSNLYIDNLSSTSLGQGGLISNLIPIKERLQFINKSTDKLDTLTTAKRVLAKINKQVSCASCEYINVCSLIGSSTWFDYWKQPGCPYNLKSFLDFSKGYLVKNSHISNTCYNTNPVQSKLLIKEKNNTAEFYESKFNNEKF